MHLMLLAGKHQYLWLLDQKCQVMGTSQDYDEPSMVTSSDNVLVVLHNPNCNDEH